MSHLEAKQNNVDIEAKFTEIKTKPVSLNSILEDDNDE